MVHQVARLHAELEQEVQDLGASIITERRRQQEALQGKIQVTAWRSAYSLKQDLINITCPLNPLNQ
jgi:hypothetical protein